MLQQMHPRITVQRAIVAYIVAILAGSLAVAAIFLVNWLRANGYEPSRDHHLFAATFLFPLLIAGVISLVGLAPILLPIYVFCIIAIQKWTIRSWAAFVGMGIVFSSVAWSVVSAYYCLRSTCSTITLASIAHIPLESMVGIVVIGAASGLACRSVLVH
ncbi:hypothetical protein R70006_06781 [Paraburkholderia domus]|nr:hypothetical protein [Paraburkholderia domus]CAE6823101.1 hypothetical protein R75483_06338 [Paraburkholderia domus]CAE6833895.1 hypothetical protein R70006_06781 [Paraburkholderia domus]